MQSIHQVKKVLLVASVPTKCQCLVAFFCASKAICFTESNSVFCVWSCCCKVAINCFNLVISVIKLLF